MAHSRVAFAVAVTLERLPLLPLVARNVERVAAQCGSAAVVIVRDHEATDAKVARAWRRGAPQAATDVHVLAQRPCAQGMQSQQRAGRMEKLAAVRNTYWDFLFSTGFNESHGGLAAVDYVVAVDSDMCRQWAPAGFAAAFGVPPPWAAVFSNGIAPPGTRSGYWFTDHLALQGRPGTPVPWIRRDGLLTKSPERRSYKVIHPATAAFEVNSAFGGVGIYRTAAARGCRHACSRQSGCEHHSFHACLRGDGGRLLLHPRLIIEWHEWPSAQRPSQAYIKADCKRSWRCEKENDNGSNSKREARHNRSSQPQLTVEKKREARHNRSYSCGPPRGYEPARQLSCAQVNEQMGPAAYRRANTRAPPTPAPGAAPAIHTRCKEDASAYGSCCSRWAHGDDEDLFSLL